MPYTPTLIQGAKPQNGATVFRGITEPEHNFIAQNQHVRSNESQSIRGEGTCFGDDWGTAESYVNGGRSSDPTHTGQNTYVLEVQHGPEIGMDKADGYWKTSSPIHESRIKRVWQFTPQGHIAEGVWQPGKGFAAKEPHKPYHRWHNTGAGEFDSAQEANGPVEKFVAKPPNWFRTTNDAGAQLPKNWWHTMNFDGTPLQKSFAETPMGVQLQEAPGGLARYDYSHMLTPEQRALGYQLHIECGPDSFGSHYVNADILCNNAFVGGIQAYMGDAYRSLIDPNQTHRSLNFFLSDLEDDHQGKGLGPLAYEAVIAHARNTLGATHVQGGEHSSMAHRVHEKIAAKYGLAYHADLQKGENRNGAFDKKYSDYTYAIDPKPLQKTMVDSDFKSVVGALDPAGTNVVDHAPHLNAHPPTMEHNVGHYAQTFLYNPSIVRKIKSPKLGGISKKVVFEDGVGNRFMVKPYHERVTKIAKSFMHRPTQGWAEIANQALFHAAGMGHMHQKVHVAEHNMGPGHENEPGVVVHMEPGMDEIMNLQSKDYHPSMASDGARIAAMDYLANNIDRHGHNILYRKAENHDPMSQPSRLLAIDHGRNFQYKVGAGWDRDKLNDSFYNYFQGGLQHIVDHARKSGTQVNNAQHFVSEIQHWWPSVRNNVIGTMHQHVGSVKDQGARDHIWKNFMERVGKLDDMTRFPDEFIDGDMELYRSPIYSPKESVNAYNPWQREF